MQKYEAKILSKIHQVAMSHSYWSNGWRKDESHIIFMDYDFSRISSDPLEHVSISAGTRQPAMFDINQHQFYMKMSGNG